jgi:hypothetical protein
MKEFNTLCTPAKLYFALAVLSSVVGLIYNMSIMAILIKLLFAFIWTYILNWICKKGYKSVSWFLVLLPYIIMGLSLLGYNRAMHQAQKQEKVKQNKDAESFKLWKTRYA